MSPRASVRAGSEETWCDAARDHSRKKGPREKGRGWPDAAYVEEAASPLWGPGEGPSDTLTSAEDDDGDPDPTTVTDQCALCLALSTRGL